MSRLVTTLIFINFLRMILTEEPTIISNESVETEEEAAELFAEIQPNEALPLILFKRNKFRYNLSSTPMKHVLNIPDDAIEAATLQGKMVKGTQFSYLKNTQDQMFFCPDTDSEKACLVPQNFEEKVHLKCAREPTPTVEIEIRQDSCGADVSNTPYSVYYSICPNEKEYETDYTMLYAFCYNEQKRRTIYAAHKTFNPRLLKSNLLYRERKVPYLFTESELKPINFEGEGMDEALKNMEFDSITHPTKKDYGIQKLVPDTDMAFALWRKATYQNFNLDWQHLKLIPLWNKINNYVKSEAIQLFERSTELNHEISVFEIDSESQDDAQLFNIWIKIITTESNVHTIRGIAILMNNFITPGSITSDSKSPLNTAEKAIEKLCADKNNKCTHSLLNDFQEVNSVVRCCSINVEIGKVFGWRAIDTRMPLLDIPGITTEIENVP